MAYSWIVISILLLILVSFNSYLSSSTINKLSNLHDAISESEQLVSQIESLHVSVLTAESAVRGFLLTGNKKYLSHYYRVFDEIEFLSEKLSSKANVSALTRQRIGNLIEMVTLKLEYMDYVSKLDEGNISDRLTIEALSEEGKGFELYAQMFALLNVLKDGEENFLAVSKRDFEVATAESKTSLYISLLISVLLVAGVYILARVNAKSQIERQNVIEAQNDRLQSAVAERTQELSLFSEELKRSNRELEDFAFVASHDLQEPLRKIMAFGDRMTSQSDNLSEKQHDYLNRMRGAAARMSKLISDLLEFSRINTRGKPFVNVNLNKLLGHVIDDLSLLAEESNAKISFEKLPNINADPVQIQQLFTNLITNGIKFSKHQSQPSIKISVKKLDETLSKDIHVLSQWYEFTVCDNGIGFDQEHAEKIFAPFQRLHTRSEFKGTGIGLAICRRIIERHNGSIKATSVVGQGASFIFKLPADNELIVLVDEEDTSIGKINE